MKYRFIEKHRPLYAVRSLCQALGVSPSGYYAWQQRQTRPEDRQLKGLLAQIRRVHTQSRRTYGSPRVHAQLKNEGFHYNRKRIARLMRLHGIVGQRKHRKRSTTNSRHTYPVAPNRLNQNFQAEAANQKWVADFTYIPTREGWLYLAVVLDLYSRKAVGWSMQADMTTALVAEALQMALYERQPDPGLLHHSDRGSQYASQELRRLLDEHHITVSMSRTGNCYDNAVMESFFSTLKSEWVNFQDYPTRTQARRDIFSYIAGFYNRVRLHSTLGYQSPDQFEAQDVNPA